MFHVALAVSAAFAATTERQCLANRRQGDAVGLGIQWACSEGGVDCSPIAEGGALFYPNDKFTHGDYVFNQYYQAHKSDDNSCNFGGAAYLSDCVEREEHCQSTANATEAQMVDNLVSLCGPHALGSRCDAILPGGASHEPATLRDHVNWALDLSYHLYRCYAPVSACNFTGAEVVFPQ